MRKHLLAFVTASLFASTVTAQQQASYTFFGQGSGSPFGPQLTVSGTPQIGTTFTIGLGYTNPPQICTLQLTFWQAVLIFGFSNQTWAGMQLPAAFPQGFTLLVSADSGVFQTTTSNGCPPQGGNAPQFPVSVPNDPNLIGFRFFNQMILAQVGSTTAIATDGGDATVGV